MDSLKKNTESSKAELQKGLQAVLGLGSAEGLRFRDLGFR